VITGIDLPQNTFIVRVERVITRIDLKLVSTSSSKGVFGEATEASRFEKVRLR